MDKSTREKFIICNYVVFWIALLMTGLVCYTVGKDKPILCGTLENICSWMPTCVVLIGLSKWNPKGSRKEFVKSLFSKKIKWGIVLPVILIQIIIFIVSVVFLMKRTGNSGLLLTSAPLIISNMIDNLISGAMGEEICWRGVLHSDLVPTYGVVKGSVMVGVVWAFWHAPLWFLTSGYHGGKLLLFIAAFLVFIISTAVVIGITYENSKNLLVPVVLHFVANFLCSLYTGDTLEIRVCMAVCYAIFAVVYAIKSRIGIQGYQYKR